MTVVSVDCQQLAAEDQRRRRDEERRAQHGRDQLARGGALDVQTRQHEQGQRRHRHAAERQASDDVPFDGSCQSVDQSAAGLGDSGIK
jgi:hypothetical protein